MVVNYKNKNQDKNMKMKKDTRFMWFNNIMCLYPREQNYHIINYDDKIFITTNMVTATVHLQNYSCTVHGGFAPASSTYPT